MFNENAHFFLRFRFLEYPPILSSYMLTVCGKFARRRPRSKRVRVLDVKTGTICIFLKSMLIDKMTDY